MMVITLNYPYDHPLPDSRRISAAAADIPLSRFHKLESRVEGWCGHAGSYPECAFYPGFGFRPRSTSIVGESSKYGANGDRSRHSRKWVGRRHDFRIQAD